MKDNTNASKQNKKEVIITLTPELPTGSINETVTVFSNLPGHLKKTLRLSGVVFGDIEVIPLTISFIISAADTVIHKSVQNITITNHLENNPLEIVDVIDIDNMLEIIQLTVTPGQKYKLEIKPVKEKLKGVKRFDGNLKIVTNNSEYKEFIVNYKLIRRPN